MSWMMSYNKNESIHWDQLMKSCIYDKKRVHEAKQVSNSEWREILTRES